MTTATAWFKVEGERLAENLQELCATLETTEGGLALDFSSVRRVDPKALTMLAALADKAEEKGIAVELAGVHVDVYRVLKLMKITSRFSFLPKS